jgi:hypothetical protein
VFFADGNYVGPDTTQFFAKIEALRNANLDLRREMESKNKHGGNQSEVFDHLSEIARGPQVRLGRNSTMADYYNHFKKTEAEDLLRMRGRSGDQQVLDYALQPLRKLWPEIRRTPKV